MVDYSPAEVRYMQSVLDRARYMSFPLHDPMRLEQMIDRERAQPYFETYPSPGKRFSGLSVTEGHCRLCSHSCDHGEFQYTERDKFWPISKARMDTW